MVASAEIQAALPHRSLAELKLRWEAIRGGYGIERHWVDKPEPLALGSLIGFRPLFGAEVNSPEFRWAEKRTTEDPITGHKTVWLNCSCNAEAFASPEPLVTQIPVLDDYEGIIEERLLAQVAQGTILSKAEISRQKMIIIEDLAREEARRLEERLASLHGGSPIPPLPPRTHESTSTSSEDHSTDASGHRPFMRGGWSRPPSPSDPWRRRDSEDTTESSEAHSPIEAGGFSSARRGGWSCPPAPPDPWRSRDEDEGSYSDEADSIDSSTEYSDESSEGEEDASIEVSLGAEDGSIDLSSEYSVEGSEEEDASSVSSNEDSDVGSEGGESDDSPEEGIRPVLRGSWQTGVAPTPGSSTTRAIASTALTMWDDRLGDHAQRGDTLGRLAGVDPKNTDTWVREGN
jgi:hypothetical protein